MKKKKVDQGTTCSLRPAQTERDWLLVDNAAVGKSKITARIYEQQQSGRKDKKFG